MSKLLKYCKISYKFVWKANSIMSRILRLCMLCTLFLAGVFIGNAREKVKIFYIRLDHDIDNIARNRITKAIADAENR